MAILSSRAFVAVSVTAPSAVRHQHEVGSDLGDSFKEMVGGERALKAGGHGNTINQFAAA